MDLWEFAEQQRDKGMAESADHSGQEWVDYATEFLRSYLEHNETMFCDDLWSAGLSLPESLRALGQVIRKAAIEKWIEPIKTPQGWYAAKKSVNSNLQLKPVWKSLICVRGSGSR